MAIKAKDNRASPLDRTRIARATFAAAEAMGIADRELVEQLTSHIIERLEQQARPLPGMEGFVSPGKSKKVLTYPGEADIQAMVKEALSTAPQTRKAERVVDTPPQAVSPGGMNLSQNALVVLERRYLKKDAEGRPIETPEEMFQRVARNIASAELIYDSQADVRAIEKEFLSIMTGLDFLPNSPTLMNAGRELQQLSACFVIPIEDSMESIFNAVKYTALIHKSGGGTGFSFSKLRPEKDRVGSTGGVASGPVSFMRAFDTATDVIKQGGMRRGANMAILNVNHPDILKFIEAKRDPAAFTNFNLSVAATADFMEAVERNADYDLLNPHTGALEKRQNAREVFEKIIDMTWGCGDPGIVFIDRINQANPTPKLGNIESTNPCGEQPLLPFESCNLGSINLARMLRKNAAGWEVDYPRLARTVSTAVRFLDNVIDMNRFPLPQIERMTKLNRKIGLGVMGFADLLIKLEIPYNSEPALLLAENLMRFIREEALSASEELAKKRGVFPAFEGSSFDVAGGRRVRNATMTTIAPTGTLSIIAGCSSGIEPLFALSYVRNILDGDRLIEVHPFFEQVAKEKGFYSEEMIRELAAGKRLQDMEEIPDGVKHVFVTAHEISPEWHVRMQAAFQKHTDNAVSKTVNFPHSATREEVSRVYMLAYREGVKGITIYRDGSRQTQVLTLGHQQRPVEGQDVQQQMDKAQGIVPRARPKITTGLTERVTTGCGYIYVTVNSDEQGICEVFASLGKAGGCASAQLEALSRLTSSALRAGLDPASLVKHLKGIRCPSIAWEEGHAVLSCADAIGTVLNKHLGQGGDASIAAQGLGIMVNMAGQCPECGSLLVYQEGCYHCPGCGYTRCA